MNNYIITPLEFKVDAIASAQQFEQGVVLTLSTTSISFGNCGQEVGLTTGQQEQPDYWTIQISYASGLESTTYADSKIEENFLQTGIFTASTLLPVGTYFMDVPLYISKQGKLQVLSYIRDVLQEHDNFVKVIISDDSGGSSRTPSMGL